MGLESFEGHEVVETRVAVTRAGDGLSAAMEAVTARLFHFTCSHGAGQIGARGDLVPQVPHPLLGCSVIWLTTEGRPDREATGLTSRYTSCDRMAYRYVVTDLNRCRPWLGSPERDAVPADHVADLERYGAPEQWWITNGVRARLA